MSSDTPYAPPTAELISKTIEALAARNVDAVLVASREAALAKLRELVPEGSEVSSTLRRHWTPLATRSTCTATTATSTCTTR